MKLETYYKAMELNGKIEELSNSINQIENNKGQNSASPPINVGLYDEEEADNFKTFTINYLKRRLNVLKKQFDNLK